MPFLKSFFDKLTFHCKKADIAVVQLAHHNFRERYTFNRGEENAIVDFIYNGDGFFGNVLPMANKCNSSKLLADIKALVNSIKEK